MKISENLGVMYGQNFQNFSKYVRITAGLHGKGQILAHQAIVQKNSNLFGPANQAFKNGNLFGLASKNGDFALRQQIVRAT